MTGLIQDLRYAVRALKRAPGFAAVSIITLALGIAATTIVYSIVDGILLRPLPIEDADRVMLARETINGQDMSVSWPNFQDWQKRQTSFELIGRVARLDGQPHRRRTAAAAQRAARDVGAVLDLRRAPDHRPRLHAGRRSPRRSANRAGELRVLADGSSAAHPTRSAGRSCSMKYRSR